MPQIDVKIPEYAEPYLKPAKYKSLSGGRAAGKSLTFAQMAVLRMGNYLPYYPPGPVRIASGREHKVNIPESVKQAIEHYIYEWELQDEFDINKFEINHKRTGSHLWFPAFGVNPNAFRSTFKVNVLWIEEAQFLPPDHMKVIAPSIFRQGGGGDDEDDLAPGAEIWFSWNPLYRTDWVWQRFEVKPQPGDLHKHVTWRDNPFFPADANELRLEDKATLSEAEYEHIWDGVPDDGDGSKQVLTRNMLDACVRAFREGLAPSLDEITSVRAGLDLADGGAAQNFLTIRKGPVVLAMDRWPGVSGDLNPTAKRAHESCVEHGVTALKYDAATPIGGNFKPMHHRRYSVRGIGFGDGVLGPDVMFERGRTNKASFARLNAQMAEAVRLRATRTVRLLNGDTSVNPMLCLFIDPAAVPDGNLEAYFMALSQAVRRKNPASLKWEIDKTGGDDAAPSPDEFDSLCLSFVDDCRRLKAR